MLPKLDNWQFVFINRKINFEHERHIDIELSEYNKVYVKMHVMTYIDVIITLTSRVDNL